VDELDAVTGSVGRGADGSGAAGVVAVSGESESPQCLSRAATSIPTSISAAGSVT
jgi:hypothetical protein